MSDVDTLLDDARAERDRLHSATPGSESQLEVYLKTGRTRTFTMDCGAASVHHTEERGWAVRSESGRTGGFSCGTGLPHLPLEPARTKTEDLPEAATTSFLPPPDLDAALLSEGDGLALLRSVAAGLESEMAGARLLRGRIEDGSAVSALASSRGVEAVSRFRVATLRVQAVGPDTARGDVSLAGAAREARGLSAQAVARRLADRLIISTDGVSGVATKSPAVISPEVSTALLESIVPLFVGPQLWSTARSLAGPSGRIAADGLDLVDDARLASGLVPQGVDGEGLPTGRTTLVDGGLLRQPLLSRHEVDFLSSVDSGAKVVGCRYRASYRDTPSPGPSHLFPVAREPASVASLIRDLGGGFYFIDVTGPVRRHFGEGWVQVPVCGFQVRGGRATGPVRGVRLFLKIGEFLRSVRGLGRDLRFRPRNGCIGAPSMLLAEVEILPD